MGYRLGIDVGGTNTDAVIIDDNLNVVAKFKTPTTKDVSTGIQKAIKNILKESAVDKDQLLYATLGTTHCTNAIVERKLLGRVAIIRIGKPATMAITPMIDWPSELTEAIGGEYFFIGGGHELSGLEISALDTEEIKAIATKIKGKVDAIAISSVFSPINSEHEKQTAELLTEELGEISISLSHEIGAISLLERENATILNAALTEVAKKTASGFQEVLREEGITNTNVYLCQNDGTLMSVDYAMKYPILTVACGPTNSIRGASFVSEQQNAIVLDVGGTTSDIGIIMNSFPRESSVAVEIGGVRTNFRMPDLISIGVGGGTIIRSDGDEIKIGPDSVGYRLTEESLVFGGNTLTFTDIAVCLGLADIGDPSKVESVDKSFARKALNQIMDTVNEAIDKMKISSKPVPIVLVGGGSALIPVDEIEGASEIIKSENYDVANALGAATAQVSGQVDAIFSLDKLGRDETLQEAKEIATQDAIKAGADPSTVQIVDVEDIPLAYLPGNSTRIKVKAAGDFKKT